MVFRVNALYFLMLPTSCSEGKIPRADEDVLVLHVGGECNNSGGKRRHKKNKASSSP